MFRQPPSFHPSSSAKLVSRNCFLHGFTLSQDNFFTRFNRSPNSEEKFSLPIANLSNPVVDTTGAGDAFNAGLAAALTEGKNIKDSLIFASATAGLSTTKIGTANSMPSREEIDRIL